MSLNLWKGCEFEIPLVPSHVFKLLKAQLNLKHTVKS